jgi:hypothetical protein
MKLTLDEYKALLWVQRTADGVPIYPGLRLWWRDDLIEDVRVGSVLASIGISSVSVWLRMHLREHCDASDLYRRHPDPESPHYGKTPEEAGR